MRIQRGLFLVLCGRLVEWCHQEVCGLDLAQGSQKTLLRRGAEWGDCRTSVRGDTALTQTCTQLCQEGRKEHCFGLVWCLSA